MLPVIVVILMLMLTIFFVLRKVLYEMPLKKASSKAVIS
jgi:hypothetical protein